MNMEDYKEDPTLFLWTIRNNPQVHRHKDKVKYDQERLDLLAQLADIDATINRYDRLIAKTREIVSQAEVVTDAINSSNVDVHQNVLDVSGIVANTSSSGVSKVPSIGQREVLSMSAFLERPIEIDTFEVKIGDDTSAVYPLWDLITSNPSVRAKLRNFAYLKANLRVRIAISGTPFHAGKYLVSYQPYPLNNDTLQHLLTMVTAIPSARTLLLSYLSQAPGSIVMDVKDNRPMELLIPFISSKPMHRLFNVTSSAISAATSFVDLLHAGSLYFYSLNSPSAVSASPSPISIQIYSWMEAVELGTTTATQLEITTEGERGPGPVERVATALSTFSAALIAVPSIAPLARASTMFLSGVAGVASWFGWSRPIIEDDTRFMKSRPFTNSCVTIGKETSEKLTYDPLQELNVDPRICGIDKDELVLSHLCAIESFLTTFTWSPLDTPLADPIWLTKVTPTLSNFVVNLGKAYVVPSPMAFVATCFQYWRGTIKFRFQVVCSAFHRGKLAFFFEPNINQYAIIDADIATNKNFLKIIDIQETQCVEFCVHWAQPRAWALVPLPTTADDNFSSSGTLANIASDYQNGYIGVVPFTDLQSPLDDDVLVNVFVSGEDLQFNDMTDYNFPTDREVVSEAANLTDNKNDTEVTCLDLNETTGVSNNTSDYHFGEQPLSFRTMLKRYVRTAVPADRISVGGNFTLRYTGRILPLPMPQYGTTSVGNVNLMSYLRYAFLGVKGGIRKRFSVMLDNLAAGGQAHNLSGCTIVSLSDPFSTPTLNAFTDGTDVPYPRQRGSVMYVPNTNGGIEFEIPYYSNNLFTFSCTDDGVGTQGTDEMEINWLKAYLLDYGEYRANGQLARAVECSAAAEDFTFMRFLGAPYYSYTT
jgi:hypothetical protein